MSQRVFVLGASGTIGRATVRALVQRGLEVVCFLRAKTSESRDLTASMDGAAVRWGNVQDAASLAADGFKGEHFDVLVSCLASRSGAPKDAWAIDHRAHLLALQAAQTAGVTQMVLLSAICVQKPRLAFQQAKLAFEKTLIESGLRYSIVRPTAFFKSLSGQVQRVKAGKPFLLFGDGRLTACKPVSDADLANYIVDCIDDPERHNRILPIGGPGPAITPLQQGETLFRLMGRTPRFKQVPVRLMDAIVNGLSMASKLLPPLAAKAELARIGRYYATESMLVWDAAAGRYDEALTPSTGTDTLFDYYAQLLSGQAQAERGEHAVF